MKHLVLKSAFITLIALSCAITLPIHAEESPAGPDAQPIGPVTPDEFKGDAPEPAALEEALTLYNRGVELFQISQLQAEKGNKNGQKDLLKQSIKAFEEALVFNPRLVEAQSNIGFAELTLAHEDNAIKAFTKALEIDPYHLNSLNGLSTAHALDGNIDESISLFDRLVTLEPSNPEYLFNKGSVLQKAGRLEDALKTYEEVLNIDSEYQRALFNMATLHQNMGQYREAKPLYERAKSVNISNTIGLEAVRRLREIDLVLAQPEVVPEKEEETPEAAPAEETSEATTEEEAEQAAPETSEANPS